MRRLATWLAVESRAALAGDSKPVERARAARTLRAGVIGVGGVGEYGAGVRAWGLQVAGLGDDGQRGHHRGPALHVGTGAVPRLSDLSCKRTKAKDQR